MGFPQRLHGHDDNNEVIVTYLAGERVSTADPYHWQDRTMQTAHLHIRHNWATLRSGDVVDVEFILGERVTPKPSAIGPYVELAND